GYEGYVRRYEQLQLGKSHSQCPGAGSILERWPGAGSSGPDGALPEPPGHYKRRRGRFPNPWIAGPLFRWDKRKRLRAAITSGKRTRASNNRAGKRGVLAFAGCEERRLAAASAVLYHHGTDDASDFGGCGTGARIGEARRGRAQSECGGSSAPFT